MPPKYELTAEQLALQEERRRLKAEKQAALAAAAPVLNSPSNPEELRGGKILKRDWIRKRAPYGTHSAVKVMTWNVNIDPSTDEPF